MTRFLSSNLDNASMWESFFSDSNDSVEHRNVDPLFAEIKINDDGSFDVPKMNYIHEIGAYQEITGTCSLREELGDFPSDVSEYLKNALVLTINNTRQSLVAFGNNAPIEEPWLLNWGNISSLVLSYIGEILESQTKIINELKALVTQETKSHVDLQRLGSFPLDLLEKFRETKKRCTEEISYRNVLWRCKVLRESQRLSNSEFQALQINVWHATMPDQLDTQDLAENNEKMLLSNIPATLNELCNILSAESGRPFEVYKSDLNSAPIVVAKRSAEFDEKNWRK